MAPEESNHGIDRDQKDQPQRGPAGDARPNPNGPDPRARPGQPPEEPEDRPNVGSVTPDDYPEKANGKDI